VRPKAPLGLGDCNLDGMGHYHLRRQWPVRANLVVTKGPFGANAIVGGATQPCLVSVTQATPSPTQEADAPISFR
jgi:hypothetical protein